MNSFIMQYLKMMKEANKGVRETEILQYFSSTRSHTVGISGTVLYDQYWPYYLKICVPTCSNGLEQFTW